MTDTAKTLDDLYTLIQNRKSFDPNVSYTSKLLNKGTIEITKKLGEEAVETIIAGLKENNDKIVKESADLLFHLFVLWAHKGITPSDVIEELIRRKGISGIEEKINRS